jgi:predicted MFS family arabinose efflux permease
MIGLDSFALGAPTFLLTLLGGVLADRGDRRRIIAVFQSIQMLCPTLLVVLLLTGAVHPWIIICLSLVVGITDALSMPSFQSIVPSLVEHSQISQGLALNSIQFNLSRILGPSIAGILLVSMGAAGCFAISALSYLPFIAVALWILPRGKTAHDSTDATSGKQMFAGARNIVADPNLRGALLTVLTTSFLCGPLITFTPVLVKESLNGDAAHFSIGMAAFGVGGMLGAFSLLLVSKAIDLRSFSSRLAAVYGFTLVLAALNTWYWGLPILLIFAGLCMTASNTAANSILQTSASPQLRGQTVSLYMLAMRGGLSSGSLITGISVHLLGVRNALIINGCLAVAIHLYTGWAWHRAKMTDKTLASKA